MKILYVTAFLLFFSIGAVWLLLILSNNRNGNIKNNFIRHFSPNLISNNLKILELDHNSFYLAGVTTSRIYLGNKIYGNLILETNHELSDWQYKELDIERFSPFKLLKLTVDSPYFYLMDGITPITLMGNLIDLKVREAKLDSLHYFGSEPITPSSFVLRAYDDELGRFILIKKRSDTSFQKKAPEILEKQVEGIFCTRGMLHFDKSTSKIIYLYSYRNEYISTDTNLNIEYSAKTIDTISRAQVKVTKVNNGKTPMLAAPPLEVNINSCVWGDKLFVHSGLLADNEAKEEFERNAVIDVYSLKKKSYLFSFYIPELEDNEMSGFKVYNKTVFALFDRYLVKFKLKF